ncbi:MAG: T9SS type A sorting domain-containing protein, partial [Bacteroidales bacterium]|nr:T9SS type A sorting domain-containing protein [Bacteroidales bacterium]
NIYVNFADFETEEHRDFLYIYDGPDINSPLIAEASGQSLAGQQIISSGECMSFRFTSDGSVNYTGWSANVFCKFPYQDYTVDITSILPPVTNQDSMWTDICLGETVSFTASVDFPNSGVYYDQTIENTEFNWIIAGNEIFTESSLGLNEFSHTFNNSGGYKIYLKTIDHAGYEAYNTSVYRVRVSNRPDFSETSSDKGAYCFNENIKLFGTANTVTWEPIQQSLNTDTVLIGGTDQNEPELSIKLLNTNYSPNSILTDINDILGICVNMEHSYMGDLAMKIECPNGNTMQIFNQGGGGTIIGEPVAMHLPVDANPSDTTPGIGYDYCWSPTSTSGFISNSSNWQTISPYIDPIGNVSNSVNQLISGTYQIEGNWNDLVGCPINGEWTLLVTDHLSLDNGYIFSWEIKFAEEFYNFVDWSFTNSFEIENSFWQGEGISQQNTGSSISIENTIVGEYEYTYIIVDDFGCQHDTTLYIAVVDAFEVLDSINICEGDLYYWHGNEYTEEGVYYANYQFENDCDSTYILDLKIIPLPNTEVTQEGITLTATETDAYYQWLDCNNDYAIIEGETGQSFTATENGKYAVEVEKNGCKAISDCYEITTVGIFDRNLKNISVYPNPSDGRFTIDLGEIYEEISYEIIDLQGRTILKSLEQNVSQINVETEIPSGFYLLNLIIDNNINTFKLKVK